MNKITFLPAWCENVFGKNELRTVEIEVLRFKMKPSRLYDFLLQSCNDLKYRHRYYVMLFYCTFIKILRTNILQSKHSHKSHMFYYF